MFYMIIYLYKRNWRFLSGRLMVLAILLYELFIHHTQIDLPKHRAQFLSNQQPAYQTLKIWKAHSVPQKYNVAYPLHHERAETPPKPQHYES